MDYLIQVCVLSTVFYDVQSTDTEHYHNHFYNDSNNVEFLKKTYTEDIQFDEFGGVINARGLQAIGSFRHTKNAKNHLFNSDYDADIIPLPILENENEKNEPLRIETRLQLLEFTKFDTLNEELNVLLQLDLRWYDHRLKFKAPEDSIKLFKIDIPVDYVWTPNIGITNDITGQSRFTTEDNTNKVEVWGDGTILWRQISAKIVKCKLNMKHFPFDLQKCTLILDTVTDLGKVNLTLFRSDDNFDTKQKLNLWSIVDSKLFKSKQSIDEYCSSCKPIRYTIIFKRKSSSYITDIIVPCTLLCLLSGFSLWIEAGNSQRLELNLSVLVAVSVYQLLASSNLPTSDTIPDLTLFLLVQNILVFMSICVTLILWQFKSMLKSGVFACKETIKANDETVKLELPIPVILYVVVKKYLGFLLLMRFDPEFQKIVNKVEEINDHLDDLKDNNKTNKEMEFRLIEMKLRLFFITIDRFFAVTYLIILISWIIWISLTTPDDKGTIEDFWREESEL